LFTRILIANRGEIAVRIACACRELGIRTVAVYSEADAGALHIREADEGFLLGAADPAESYLNIDRIVEAARRTGCQAVHPGYGFLSENADFAAAVEAAGVAFIGPAPDTLRWMGDKTEARVRARKAGVPVVPGFEGKGRRKEFGREAERLGYPVLVKAAGGGGGRGMRIVSLAKELPEALESARREAASAFGDDRVFLEKYLPHSRHVEFQVLGDGQGQVVHLFERDCSIQRRHQKILEETPSPALSPSLRERMGASAVAVARSVSYRNAGTVEFLLDPESEEFYFLEMNTRLQVEHPITEILTGIDLVVAQLRIAAGEPLSLVVGDPLPRGHVLECRIYAEDPAVGFLPAPGPVLRFVEPHGPGVRVDAGYAEGDEVPIQYDPMMAKVVTWAQDRAAAIRKMDWALSEMVVLGVTTNIPFLRAILAHPHFQRGEVATDFVSRHLGAWSPPGAEVPDEVLMAAALAESGAPDSAETLPVRRGKTSGNPHTPWDRPDAFRVGG